MNRPTAEVVREQNARLHASGWLERQLTTKRCATCGERLPLEAFGKRAGYAGRRMSGCRPCDAARKRTERARAQPQ
jgi:hypothetical protein